MLKHLRLAFQIFVITLVLMGTGVGQVFAAPYGECGYGQGNYNQGSSGCNATPIPTPAANNTSSSSSGGSPSPSSCTTEKPASAPDLFQINAKSTSVTLFFGPSSGQWDRYFVSYSTNSSAQDYGFEVMNSSNGVVSTDVGSLQARTVYYFRVRAGNGCQPGDWSNTLSVQSGQRFPSFLWSALPRIIATDIRRQLQPSSVQPVTVDPMTLAASTFPLAKPTTPPTQPLKAPQQEETPASPSFLQRIGNFLRGLWK